MAKMYFGKSVKYQGVSFPPNTPFEVLDVEVEDLRKAGGWLVEDETPKEEAPKAKPKTTKK
jgi:hypothetical protein